MLGNLSGIHLLVLVLVILLLFGAPKLPALARSMGQSMRIFRKEVQTLNAEKSAQVPDGSSAPIPGDTDAAVAGTPTQTAAPLKP